MNIISRRLLVSVASLVLCLVVQGCTSYKQQATKPAAPKFQSSKPGWEVAVEDYFAMELPADMKRKKAESFDSTVGIYKSSTMELHFDAKDALVYEARRARARLAELQREFKPNSEITEGGKGVIEVNGRLAYLQHEQSKKWKALGYPYENVLQIFFPDPSGGSLSVLVVFKSPEQVGDAVTILRSIRFRR